MIAVLWLALVTDAAPAADCSSHRDGDRYASTELRLRAGPATFYDTYAVLPRGQRIHGAGTGEWVRVTVPALSLNGYVAGRYLSNTCIEGTELSRRSLGADEIATILMSRSRAGYSGSCPCPYNTDRAGRRCGGRSAYSRPGGASPLCYRSDVSEQMIARFRSGG